MIAILGIMIATWQIIEEVKKHGSRFKIFAFSAGIIALGWLTIDQHNRTVNKDDINNQKFENLTSKINVLVRDKAADSLKATNDSIKDIVFQQELFKEFKITRDTVLNKPVKTYYTTNIQNAEKVSIGPNK